MSDEFSKGQAEAIRPLLFLLFSTLYSEKQVDKLVELIETTVLPRVRERGSPEEVAGAESILLYLTSMLKERRASQAKAS